MGWFVGAYILAVLPAAVVARVLYESTSPTGEAATRASAVAHHLQLLGSQWPLHKLSQKFGGLMSVPCIVISSAEVARELFKSPDLAFSERLQATLRRMTLVSIDPEKYNNVTATAFEQVDAIVISDYFPYLTFVTKWQGHEKILGDEEKVLDIMRKMSKFRSCRKCWEEGRISDSTPRDFVHVMLSMPSETGEGGL